MKVIVEKYYRNKKIKEVGERQYAMPGSVLGISSAIGDMR